MTAPPASLPPPENAGPPQGPSADAELLQRTLVPAVDRLYARLDERWKNYFALPANLAKVPQPPDVAQLKTSLERFDKVAADPQYQALWRQPEFKAAHQFLQEYVALLVAESPPQLDLPPPPAEAGKSNPPQR
jgi:hypothetical protein